jgi:Bacteriophage T4-like portal protein (Gp20)
MAWKKYFRTANNTAGLMSPIGSGGNLPDPKYTNYASQLPEVYIGHPNRTERYNQYEQMDMDSEVNAALDILAEFMTQPNLENGTGFDLYFKEDPTDNEVKILKDQLQQWVSLNDLNKRLFKLVRNTIKYGDQVFLRDPETFKLFWCEMFKITKVIVNEAEGKKPEQYIIKDLNINFMNLTATALSSSDTFINHPQVGGPQGSYVQPQTPYSGGSRFAHAKNEAVIDAEHVVHVSLTEGLDLNWPFGNSVLESIFKIFKQKELLEDAIIIYRIQRAPERRIFKIDVGNMPTHMAMAYVDRVKNEIHQRRIPTQTSSGQNMMDATYNPLSTNEDYFFPTTADGRGSTVEVFPGGTNLGEITDLRYFTNKMFRGLRIPSSYLPNGIDESERTFSDGKTTTALIQEWRFNQYCMRLQRLIVEKLDMEFKMFMRWRGVNIDNSLFELRFNEPQNFAKYRQAEIDASRIQAFTQLEPIPYLSKRFLLERYLDLSEEEMTRNDELWAQENASPEDTEAPNAGLRSVGVSNAGIQQDLDTLTPMPMAEPGGTAGAPDETGAPSSQAVAPGGGATGGSAAM